MDETTLRCDGLEVRPDGLVLVAGRPLPVSLRVKLEAAAADRRYIHTHFGFGYRLSPEPSPVFHKSATRA